MELDKIKSILKNSNRNKVYYRDEYNFLVWGICLNIEVETENNVNFIRIDNLSNKVNAEKIIEIRPI